MKHRDAILHLLDDAIVDLGPAVLQHADGAVREVNVLETCRVLLAGGTVAVSLDLNDILGLVPPRLSAIERDVERIRDGVVVPVERAAPTPPAAAAAPVVSSAMPACTCPGDLVAGEHVDGCPRADAIAENLDRLQHERGGIDAAAPLECSCDTVDVGGVLFHRDGCVYYRPDRHGPAAVEAIRGEHPDAYIDLVVTLKDPEDRPPLPAPVENSLDELSDPDREVAEAVNCPGCGARAGGLCRPAGGGPSLLAYVHGERVEAYREQQDAERAEDPAPPPAASERSSAPAAAEIRRAMLSIDDGAEALTGASLGRALGVSSNSGRRYLQAALDRGEVRREGTGPGTRYFVVDTPVEAAAMSAAGVEREDDGPASGTDGTPRTLLAEVRRLGGEVIEAGAYVTIKGPKGEARMNTAATDLDSPPIRAHVKRVTGLMVSGG